jgi:hypothetical protein
MHERPQRGHGASRQIALGPVTALE